MKQNSVEMDLLGEGLLKLMESNKERNDLFNLQMENWIQIASIRMERLKEFKSL